MFVGFTPGDLWNRDFGLSGSVRLPGSVYIPVGSAYVVTYTDLQRKNKIF